MKSTGSSMVSPRARKLAAGVAVAGTAALSLSTIGPAATLAAVSIWILSAGVGRAVPRLHGPAAWAAGVVGGIAFILGLSAVVAHMSPHLHSQWVNYAILIVPVIVGTVLLVLRRPSDGREDGADGQAPPSRWKLPLALTGGGLAMAAWIASRGPNYGVAWAMSGDARNHVSIMRSILNEGGISLEAFKRYPAAVNGFAAVIAGASDRGGATGQTMLSDIHAIADTYILAGIAIAVLTAGCLIEILPRAVRSAQHLPTAVNVVLVAAGLVAATPFVLGTTLADGFFSAYGALVVALCGMVLALRSFGEPSAANMCLALMIVVTPLTFLSWTVLAVIPGALTLVMVLSAVYTSWHARRARHHAAGRRPALASLLLAAVAALTCVGLLGVGYLYRVRLTGAFVLTGSITPPSTSMLLVITLVAIGLWGAVRAISARGQMLLPIAVALFSALAVLWLGMLPGTGFTWTYYALKTYWLTSVCLAWVLFAPIALWFGRAEQVPEAVPRQRLRETSVATAASVAVLLLVGSATTAPEPVRRAAVGWNQPTAQVVDKALAGANTDEPYVIWKWSDPRNDRLGNFWAALAWASDPTSRYAQIPGLEGGFSYWAYMEQGRTSDLCALVTAVPNLVVYTRDEALGGELSTECPDADADLRAGE